MISDVKRMLSADGRPIKHIQRFNSTTRPDFAD